MSSAGTAAARIAAATAAVGAGFGAVGNARAGAGGAGGVGSTTRAAPRRWGPPRASGRGDQARRDQPLQGAGLVAAVDVLDQGQGAASRVRLEVMPGAARRVHRQRAVRAVAPFGIRGAWRIPEQAPGQRRAAGPRSRRRSPWRGQQRPPRDGAAPAQSWRRRILQAYLRSSRSALARRSAAPGWSPSASHSVAVLRASSASTTARPVQQVIDQAAVSLHGAPLGTLRRHLPASRAAERAARRIRSTTAPRPAMHASWQIVATATP